MSRNNKILKQSVRKALSILSHYPEEILAIQESSLDINQYTRSLLIDLFAKELFNIELEVPNVTFIEPLQKYLKTTIHSIYSPCSPMTTEVRLLGEWYELLLNYQLHVDVSDSNPQIKLSKSQERRRKGSHYTPKDLTEKVVSKALNYRLDEYERPIKSVDLLSLRIFDPSGGVGFFLIAVCEQLSTLLCDAWRLEKQFTALDPPQLLILARRHIIEQCLYACDLDAIATKVCQMSLVILGGNDPELLSSLRHRIICADGLVSLDEWQNRFPEVFDHTQRFDLILGNPPYISMYGRGSQARFFPEDYLIYISQHFNSIDQHTVTTGRLNLFLSFMVMATRLLSPHQQSIIAFVLPDTLITNTAYSPMRYGLTQSKRLIEVQKHDCDLFSGANVGIAIVFWGNEPMGHPQNVTLLEVSKTPKCIEEDHSQISSRLHCSWLPYPSVLLHKAALKHESSVRLDQVADVRDGFNTGSASNRVRVLSRTLNPSPNTRLCLEGKWITPHIITPLNLWIKTDDLKSPSRFDLPKIMYRQTASHIIAAVDVEGLCYLNSAHAIIPFNKDPSILYALSAYLNSDPFKIRYQLLSGETRRTFPQVHVSTMKTIRMPKSIFDSDNELTQKLAAAAQLYINQRQTKTLAAINQLVRQVHINIEAAIYDA